MTNVIVGSYFGEDVISVIGSGSSLVTVGSSLLLGADGHKRLEEVELQAGGGAGHTGSRTPVTREETTARLSTAGTRFLS